MSKDANLLVKELKERNLFQQCSNEALLIEKLNSNKISFYLGIDPTGESLHCGHLVPLILAKKLQEHGHKPVILVGGGTAMIGDPSGKTKIRKMLTVEKIKSNIEKLSKQIEQLIDFSNDKALLVNNSDWLSSINYIDFLRDIGVHFSINRMLGFETYKSRLDTGLSFIEFNYLLLQSYDFYYLNDKLNCSMQIGGDDQWANMVSGIDLIRRKSNTEAFVLTVPLVTRSDGKKMGKTEKGAIYLNSNLTTTHDFFQYWRNIPDADVKKFLLIYTSLSIEECEKITSEGSNINKAKEILAYEITSFIHGKEEAEKTLKAAHALFSTGGNRDSIPGKEISLTQIKEGLSITDLIIDSKLIDSKREAKRVIEQGGVTINDNKINDLFYNITENDIKDREILLRIGKKKAYLFQIV